MDFNITSLIIFLFAVFPGFFANEIYKIIAGHNWNEDKWDNVIRSIFFSLVGLAFYFFVAYKIFNFNYPVYIYQNTYSKNFFTTDLHIETLFKVLFWHSAFSTFFGFLCGKLIKSYNRRSKLTTYSNTWNEFCSNYIRQRWVVVTLRNGEVFAGMVELIETNVKDEFRDLILDDPSKYDAKVNKFLSLEQKYLFLPGKIIEYVGTSRMDYDEQTRTSELCEKLKLTNDNG